MQQLSELYFLSSNIHKFEESQRILSNFGVNISLFKTPLEEIEDIEILRFLEMGFDVQMVKMSPDSIPVDNSEDIKLVEERLNFDKAN